MIDAQFEVAADHSGKFDALISDLQSKLDSRFAGKTGVLVKEKGNDRIRGFGVLYHDEYIPHIIICDPFNGDEFEMVDELVTAVSEQLAN
jgi:hypothetical protein